MKQLQIYSLVILIFFSLTTNAQTSDFKRQRAQLTVFNVGFNGLIGGVGRLINSKGEEVNIRTFAKGFYRGAIGGGISHIALSLSHQIDKQQTIGFAWPVRIINAVGSSIIQNAAENKRFFERVHFNLYLTRFDFYPHENRLQARLFTSSLYGLLVVGNGARFDLSKTLKTGIFYFESDGRFSSSIGSGRATGQVSSIGMRSDLIGQEFYDTYAEEVAHIMQYDRKIGGNAMVAQLDKKWKGSSSFYNSLSRYIYLDLNGPVFWVAYKLEGDRPNFFETEAVNYANRRIDSPR
ncbi:MAG: hypothetical protein AAFO69_09095 [Bacteroidota bacterium]